MKRLLSKILFILAIVLLLGAGPVLATECQGLIPCGCAGGLACTWNNLYGLINKVVTFIVDTSILLATVVIVVSGIQLVLHPSDATAKQVWKDRLWKGLIGLAIVMCAYLLVKVVVWGLTGPEETYDVYDLREQVNQ